MERTLLTVKQFSEKHQAFTQLALRGLIHKSGQYLKADGTRAPGNGLASAIIRLGDRVLLDEQKFFEWVDSQQVAK